MLQIFDDFPESSDKWILDNVCSFHMCPNQNFFCTYEVVDASFVLMGDNTRYEVTSIDTIRIKMYDGVIQTLGNVRHIFDLKCNLILLSIFDGKRYMYSIESRVTKVSRKTLVVLKESWSNYMCYKAPYL